MDRPCVEALLARFIKAAIPVFRLVSLSLCVSASPPHVFIVGLGPCRCEYYLGRTFRLFNMVAGRAPAPSRLSHDTPFVWRVDLSREGVKLSRVCFAFGIVPPRLLRATGPSSFGPPPSQAICLNIPIRFSVHMN